MFCEKCGHMIGNQILCPFCGHQNPPEEDYSGQAPAMPTEQATITFTPPAPAQQPFTPARPNMPDSAFSGYAVPVPRPEPAPQAPPAKKGGKGKKTALIIVIIILVLAIAAGVGCAVYFTSDGYKLKKATAAAEQGDYETALTTISEIYEPQAEIIRKYVALMQKKDTWLAQFEAAIKADNGTLCTSTSDKIYTDMIAFCEAAAALHDDPSIYLLSADMRAHCDYCYDCTQAIQNISLSYNTLYNVQIVLMNRVIKNTSEEFTLTQMQSNIDTTKKALADLEKELSAIPVFSKKAESSTYNLFEKVDNNYSPDNHLYALSYALVSLIDSVQAQIANEQNTIDTDVKEKKFKMDDPLHLVNPDPNFVYTVGGGLEDIGSYDNIDANTQTILNTYQTNILAWYLSQE